MSQGFPSYPQPNYYGAPPPKKKSNVGLIIAAVVGGGFLLVVLICCGAVYRFAQPPVASAAAQQPFELASVPVPQFQLAGDLPGSGGARVQEFSAAASPGTPGAGSRLWVYRPPQEAQPKSLPCVLISGAGSTLMEGMTLTEGDQAEHFPYVDAGFAVVAYDLDGGAGAGDDEARYKAFKNSRAGLVNARNALEFAPTFMPEVDPNRIFVAGHSSAASHALLFAEHEPRLAGVAAYAPCVNIPERLPGPLVRVLETKMTGLTDFFAQSSPHTHEARLNCPVFLFGAQDDDNTPLADTKKFADRLKSLGKDVTLETTASGGHYESMINEGIPRCIAWMKTK